MKKITGMFAVLVVALIALLAYVVITDKTDIAQDAQVQTHLDAKTQTDTLAVLPNEVTTPSAIEEKVVNTENEQQIMKATFNTNKGSFELELFSELAPNTVENFVKLAESNFYDGVKFHRVIKGFMVQAGDPQSKDDDLSDVWGTGGPGYTFADEIHAENNNVIGTISMANAGPNTNGSQFFINTADNGFLDGKHTVFGKVVSGMENVSTIESVETFPNDRPVEPVVIESIVIQK